jgi:hypothetical protein
VVDRNCLRQQCDQEWTAQLRVQNLVKQREAKIQQLQTRNQETAAESNAYQDRINTLQNKLIYKHANTKTLRTAAATAGTVSGQQLHVQPASILDSSRDKLWSFVSHLHMKLTGNASHFPNPQPQLWYSCWRLAYFPARAMVEMGPKCLWFNFTEGWRIMIFQALSQTESTTF